jgi:hypothetical protein
MKIKKVAILSLSIVILLQAMVFSVFAASGKVYIFTHTWSDLNTRAAGNTTVLRHLWDMGYDAGEYLNNSAADAYSVMPKSKILVIASHGAEGRIRLGTDKSMSRIYANSYVSGDNRSISNLSANSLSDTRLVLYAGCSTGGNASNGSNLVTATRSKGAQCVVGWNETIHYNPAADWIRLLFEKANKEEEVLWECFNHADYWVRDIWGSTYSKPLNNRNESGNITQQLYK